MQVVQPAGARGSLGWIQMLVNEHAGVINCELSSHFKLPDGVLPGSSILGMRI